MVLELQVCGSSTSSWFIGDSVVSGWKILFVLFILEDGKMLLATEVDPLFLLLPVLAVARSKVITFQISNQSKHEIECG